LGLKKGKEREEERKDRKTGPEVHGLTTVRGKGKGWRRVVGSRGGGE
jgi:hypothetical protein